MILAGGTGQRMGGADKAMLPLAGRTLVAHAIARLHPQVSELAISANGDPARLAVHGLPVLADSAQLGPLSGVLAAMNWASPEGATHVVTVAVDTPFFPEDLVPRLLLAAEGSPNGAALAESGGRAHPTFAIWPMALRDDLAKRLGADQRRIMDFARAHGAALASFPDDAAFLNVNAPEDLRRAEELLGATG